MHATRIGGLGVALATPFTDRGALDLPAFRRLVRHVVEGGADMLLPLGSTGEAATLVEAERDALIEACLQESRGRLVVVGTGHNATARAAEWTRRAQQLGAHGALIVSPYYNRPMPAGLVAHYRACADAAPGLPLVAYNVPARTGQNLAPAVLARLWDIDSVVAIKESSGQLAQIAQILAELPSGRCLLAGDDGLAVASVAAGATGLVSVLGNVLPREAKALVDAALAGRAGEAAAWQRRLGPLMEALFAESSPIPVKAALALLGICGDDLRLPLTKAELGTRERLMAALHLAQLGDAAGDAGAAGEAAAGGPDLRALLAGTGGAPGRCSTQGETGASHPGTRHDTGQPVDRPDAFPAGRA